MSAIDLGLGIRTRRLFSPRSLFAKPGAGAWYDPSDLGSMFQDSAGTVPAALDQPVGRLLDRSGRGNHAVQAGAALRPMLRQDGGGRYFLEFDGVDDWLRASFAIAQPYDRISAIRQIGWTVNERVFDGVTASSQLFQSSVSPELRLLDGAGSTAPHAGAAIGINAVVTERHDNANSRLAVNNGAYATGTTGTNGPGGITIGATAGGGSCGHIRLYGVAMIARALSEAEISSARRFMAARAGVAI